MANYYTQCRTNYFKVKDIEKFKSWLTEWHWDIVYISKVDTAHGELSGFYIFNSDVSLCFSEKLPLVSFDEEGEQVDVPGDFLKEFAAHLEDDWVAIYMEIGNENIRFLTGVAIAINSKGQVNEINIEDIYDLAKDLGSNMTPVEY